MALQTHRAPLAVVLALGLGLAACAPEAGQGDRAETRTRPVSEAQAQSALADFGLEEQGRASWSERRFERGAYIFTDFAMTLEDGRLTASELILTGPQRLEDQPFFTALEMQNAVIEAPDGELSTNFLSLVEPSATLARKIADLLRGEDSLEDMDEDRSEFGFARFELAELAMQFEDTPSSALSLTLGAVVLEGFEEGETLQTGQLSALTLDGRDEQGGPLSLRLGEMQVSGVKLDGLDEGSPFGASLMSPDQAPYETVALNDLLISVGGIAITLPELTASVETLGSGVLSSQLNLPSLTLSPAPGHPQSADIVRSFDMLGYDQLELSASGESRYDPETDRALTDALQADGFGYQSRDGLRLHSDDYYWVAIGCSSQSITLAAWASTKDDLRALTFPNVLENLSGLEKTLPQPPAFGAPKQPDPFFSKNDKKAESRHFYRTVRGNQLK